MKLLLNLFFIFILGSCDQIQRFDELATQSNMNEKAALSLARENRELKIQIDQYKFEIQELKSNKKFLEVQLSRYEKKEGAPERAIASIPDGIDPKDDLVQFSVYNWSPTQLLAIADKSFQDKEFKKSAQYFKSFIHHYPKHKELTDKLYFQAALAAYESQEYYQWSVDLFDNIVKEYPTSNFYRGAKLWRAMGLLKLGRKDKFFETVEEFRKHYRNTAEWKILSAHYEKIIHEYK